MLVRVRGRRGPRRHVELDEDVAQVAGHRLVAQHQDPGDIGVAPSLGHQPQHLDLTLAEATGELRGGQLIDGADIRSCAKLDQSAAGGRQLSSRRVLVADGPAAPGRTITRARAAS